MLSLLRRAALVTVTVAITTGLVACSSDDAAVTTTTTTASPPTTTPPTTAAPTTTTTTPPTTTTSSPPTTTTPPTTAAPTTTTGAADASELPPTLAVTIEEFLVGYERQIAVDTDRLVGADNETVAPFDDRFEQRVWTGMVPNGSFVALTAYAESDQLIDAFIVVPAATRDADPNWNRAVVLTVAAATASLGVDIFDELTALYESYDGSQVGATISGATVCITPDAEDALFFRISDPSIGDC